jgi:hypothetical protein
MLTYFERLPAQVRNTLTQAEVNVCSWCADRASRQHAPARPPFWRLCAIAILWRSVAFKHNQRLRPLCGVVSTRSLVSQDPAL